MKKSAKLTLNILSAVADGLLVFEMNGRYRHAFMREGMAGVRRLLDADEARSVRRRYADLRRLKLIRERQNGKKFEAALTDMGAVKCFMLRMQASRARTDGKRLLVTYDIPERQRAVRDRLRYLLKKSGFRRRQQSVWMTERDVKGDLLAWIQRNGLGDWVQLHEV